MNTRLIPVTVNVLVGEDGKSCGRKCAFFQTSGAGPMGGAFRYRCTMFRVGLREMFLGIDDYTDAKRCEKCKALG